MEINTFMNVRVRHMELRKNKGFTLIELMVVVAIIGIAATVAYPSLMESVERRKIISAAELLSADLKWAKTESIRTNQTISIDFTSGASGTWSYSITPTVPAKIVNSASYPDFSGVSMSHNFGASDVVFEPVRGIADEAGRVTFSTTNLSNDVRVSAIGRVRICSSTGVAGVEAC